MTFNGSVVEETSPDLVWALRELYDNENLLVGQLVTPVNWGLGNDGSVASVQIDDLETWKPTEHEISRIMEYMFWGGKAVLFSTKCRVSRGRKEVPMVIIGWHTPNEKLWWVTELKTVGRTVWSSVDFNDEDISEADVRMGDIWREMSKNCN